MIDPLLDSYVGYDRETPMQVIHPSNPGSYRVSAEGQSFTVPADQNYKITKAKFYLKKKGSPVGNLVAQLYKIVGTYGTTAKPTGNVLAESDPVAMTTLTGNFALRDFDFPVAQRYEMTAGAHYCIQCVIKEATTLDDDNCPRLAVDGAAPTHSGNDSRHYNGRWTPRSDRDVPFYVYGEPTITIPIKYGTVHVYAVADTEEVVADLLVDDATYTTSTTLTLRVGPYTILATYKEETQRREVIITEGVNPPITFTFGKTHTLSVVAERTPPGQEVEVPFTLNDSPLATPFIQKMSERAYTIDIVPSVKIDGKDYNFLQWEDRSVNPTRTLTLSEDLNLTATYKIAILGIEGTRPASQREIKDVLREVFGKDKDISEANPLITKDPDLLAIIGNVEHETEWATEAQCDEVSSVDETNLSADPIVVTFPVGSTRVRAILVASIHILNLAANTHHIAFKVQGDRDGDGYVDQLDLSASAQLGLVAVDASSDAWCGGIDVTSLVDASGSTYNFRFVVTSDNAGMVRYVTCFTLVLVYHM